ncbi:MAG: PTS fructose transporter subunit IIB [Atopobiaceae bacterium]|jgi:PTS system galactitol-specific IIB component|nr:PTS fructose transporter subunit IIB [Atopobiaceae bacterium]MCH4120506.1 PTS fructose transporter subunit IIB [Atopobiaceae bacterium]MCI1318730.1 PTS fructose transporter subunit IIB [Atopobiaceae bacterium]MCI1388207.1 PTS fructose transporter subunit IIB [Atopobiaceae bacterium]MCI1431543.1 PTS fructose transporter subunit IIB [Atopobiaceae bacterium]
MKPIKILCVCGSGTVSSAMAAQKLTEKLGEHGYEVHATECSPTSAETALAAGGFSLMACVSPVYQDFGIPKVNAVGLLTGFGEDKVIEDCLQILGGDAE